MLKEKMTMLILSCDKFSDLWDGHVKMLEENWPDREMDTYIVTDKPSEKSYPHVSVFSVGEGVEWSERLASALSKIKTKYVFITLDDYFLIKRVSTPGIEILVDMMEKENFDYVRLFKRPVRATGEQLPQYDRVYYVDTSGKYSVNLYSGIWKTEFMKATVAQPLNAWQFEVNLHKMAQSYGAKCAVSNNDDFVILDVVRKGKLLHHSAAYFRKHPGIYNGNREVNTWGYEIRLGIKTQVGRHTPRWLHNAIKKVMRKFGYQFYSD